MGIPTGEIDENGADIEWPSDPDPDEYESKPIVWKHPRCKFGGKNVLRAYSANKKTRMHVLDELLLKTHFSDGRESRIICPYCKRDVYVQLKIGFHQDIRKKGKPNAR